MTVILLAIILALAPAYGVDPELAIEICRLESDFDCYEPGDDGLAMGPWQFHLASWECVRTHMGLPLDDLRTDPYESTRTAMHAMGNMGLYRWWSTYEIALRRVRANP